MFSISVEKKFSSAHCLNDYNGPCARIHGHNWKVRAEIQSHSLDKTGMVTDFNIVDKWLTDVISPFDHRLINEVEPFNSINPTAENLVKYLYEQLKQKITTNVRLKKNKPLGD
jgi:6-pyruvoyltetrahydropterin/6-carboxytetrahydropterin synthase